MSVAPRVKFRDPYLDVMKGLAILLVIIGHTLQGLQADFDNLFWFRFIYSFHMPLFMFLSGMAASFELKRAMNEGIAIPKFVDGVRTKLLRLLLPFLTWSVFKYYYAMGTAEMSFESWMIKVFANPDNSLWFLLIAFYCLLIVSILSFLVSVAFKALRDAAPELAEQRWVQVLIVGAFGVVAILLLDRVPSQPWNYMVKIYLPYVLAGLLYWTIFAPGLRGMVRLLPVVIFLCLVPFYDRVNVSPLAEKLSWLGNPGSVNAHLLKIIALSGSLAALEFGRLLVALAPRVITRCLAFIGRRSLDIYAIHFYALGYRPLVLAPLAISLIASTCLRLFPLTTLIAFGQYSSLIPWSRLWTRASGQETRSASQEG